MPSVVCSGYVALILAALVGIVVGIVVFGSGLAFGKIISIQNKSHRILPITAVVALSIAIMATLIVGCSAFWFLGDAIMSSFYPPSPRREPSKQDLVGMWELTQDSLESIQEEGYEISTHTLELRADRTFMLTNLPDLVWNFGEPGRKLESGSGSWFIIKENRNWSIKLHFTELNGIADDFYAYLHLSGEEPPYEIYDYIGDPDSGHILFFEKRQESK